VTRLKHLCIRVVMLFDMLIVRCCVTCGKVLSEDWLTAGTGFIKDSSGQVVLATFKKKNLVSLFWMCTCRVNLF
jgi:hypothetical protein